MNFLKTLHLPPVLVALLAGALAFLLWKFLPSKPEAQTLAVGLGGIAIAFMRSVLKPKPAEKKLEEPKKNGEVSPPASAIFLLVGAAGVLAGLSQEACTPQLARTILDNQKTLCVLANALLGDEEIAKICNVLPGERQAAAGVARDAKAAGVVGLRRKDDPVGACK